MTALARTALSPRRAYSSDPARRGPDCLYLRPLRNGTGGAMRVLPGVAFKTVILAGVTLAAAPAWAQVHEKFPTKPVRILVSNPAGSQGDTLARMISLKMSESWGRPVV